jgi:chromosome segregation ATPase
MSGCAVFVFLYLTPFLPAQVLPSVDIDTARTQIDQFVGENELIQERMTELLETNIELATDIELWTTWLTGVTSVRDRIVDKANQLIDILSDLASKSVITQAQSVLDRYYRLKSILDEKSDTLKQRVTAATTSIERNSTAVDELQEKTQSNTDNIALLKAAIERSEGSEEIVGAYIESLEKALDDAQELINESF